ncbi:MAG: peptidase M11 [Blastocatellia bacterium]|nr:MAG: peptidase M11 [Blastocatellia bacterium]
MMGRPSVFAIAAAMIGIAWTTPACQIGLRAQERPVTAGAAVTPQAFVQFDGELEVLYEDSNAGARLRHFLRTDNRRFELRFAGERPALAHGTRVRARGTLKDNTLMLSSGLTSMQALAVPKPDTMGTQNILVILFNFPDNNTQPYSIASARAVTFTDTNNYYVDNTYKQTSLSGTVVGWYTIAASSRTCDTSAWATLAEQAAVDAGVNVASYARLLYAFPRVSACSWWGLGSVGGNPSHAFINGDFQLMVVGHELGHNLGAYHSHNSPCDATGCTTGEYGDDRDIMGSTPGHMNAFQKERLGWLAYGAAPLVREVTMSNNYWIEPLETLPNGAAKAIKILKSIDSSRQRTWYYVEVRTKTGADANVAPGVVIHTGSEASGNSSYQLDVEPTVTVWDSTLDPGQTFADSEIGLSITTLSADNTGALVQVSIDGGNIIACRYQAPTVSLSPSAARFVKPGSVVNYTVSITNNDTAGCAPGRFAFSSAIPAGWSASFSSASTIALAPGDTTTATMSVMIPENASGALPLSVSAAELISSAGFTTVIVNVLSERTK